MIQRLAFEISYLVRNTPWDSGISPKELIELLDVLPPGRALDLGCGTGTNAINMALRGWDVVGVDLSWIAIRRARQKARAAEVGVTFHQGDVTKLDHISKPFDLVLDIGCFHGLSAQLRKEYERNLRRLLKPGGTFLLYTWVKRDEADQNSTLTEAEIRTTFNSSMTVMDVERGIDTVGGNTSAWFKLQKNIK